MIWKWQLVNMVDWIGSNFGKEDRCPVCGEEDTTEHVFECGTTTETVTLKNLEEGRAMADIVRHFRETEEIGKEIITTEIQIKMNVLSTDGTL